MFENPVNKAYVGGNQIIRAYNGDGAPHIYPIDNNISELLYYPGTGDTLTITFHHYGTNETTTKPKLYYRTGFYAFNGTRRFDVNRWIEVTGNTITVTATSNGSNEYDLLQICGKGNTNFSNSQNDYTTVSIDGQNLNCVVAEWHLDTILDLDNPPTSLPDWCFYRFLYDGTGFEPTMEYAVYTDASTLGNHTFENLMNNIYSTQGLGIVMPNVTNTQSDTFRNWIMNCSSDGSKTINCPESLYLPENSNSGVPVGWYRINS